METTGVVRRIDELGRIVIPKEIRRTLGIKDGASMEIYVDRDMVALKKHSTMSNLIELSNIYSESVYATLKQEMYVTDRDNIISCPNIKKKQYLHKEISKYLEQCIEERKPIKEEEKPLALTEKDVIDTNYIIYPIITNGDVIGLVILLKKDKINSSDENIANLASQFLGKNVEE